MNCFFSFYPIDALDTVVIKPPIGSVLPLVLGATIRLLRNTGVVETCVTGSVDRIIYIYSHGQQSGFFVLCHSLQ